MDNLDGSLVGPCGVTACLFTVLCPFLVWPFAAPLALGLPLVDRAADALSRFADELDAKARELEAKRKELETSEAASAGWCWCRTVTAMHG